MTTFIKTKLNSVNALCCNEICSFDLSSKSSSMLRGGKYSRFVQCALKFKPHLFIYSPTSSHQNNHFHVENVFQNVN